MPDEAHDGRNVVLNLTSVHGVLDCPKKNQAKAEGVLGGFHSNLISIPM